MGKALGLIASFLIGLLLSACSSGSGSDDDSVASDGNGDTTIKASVLARSNSCSEGSLGTALSPVIGGEGETFFIDNAEPPFLEIADEIFECGDENEPEPVPIASGVDGSGAVNYLSNVIDIDNAILEIESKREITLLLHDGETRFVQRNFSGVVDGQLFEQTERLWGVYEGTLLVAVTLSSASAESFDVGAFNFSQNPDISGEVGVNELTFGVVVHDVDKNGEIEDIGLDESSFVSSGSVTISGVKPNWAISFDLVLESGQSVTGQYNGDYFVLPQ